MQTRWERLLAAYVRSGFRAATLNIWGGQSIQLVNKLTTALILFIGARLAIEGKMTVGELVAFNMLAGRVAEPVLRLASLWQQFQEARVGIARLGDILNTPVETEFSPSRSALPRISGTIAFDDVTFRYRAGRREALRRVTLRVAAGEVLGIVGPSGSGKSTLTKLVQRLYVPESGRVLVDGVDLAHADARRGGVRDISLRSAGFQPALGADGEAIPPDQDDPTRRGGLEARAPEGER